MSPGTRQQIKTARHLTLRIRTPEDARGPAHCRRDTATICQHRLSVHGGQGHAIGLTHSSGDVTTFARTRQRCISGRATNTIVQHAHHASAAQAGKTKAEQTAQVPRQSVKRLSYLRAWTMPLRGCSTCLHKRCRHSGDRPVSAHVPEQWKCKGLATQWGVIQALYRAASTANTVLF